MLFKASKLASHTFMYAVLHVMLYIYKKNSYEMWINAFLWKSAAQFSLN